MLYNEAKALAVSFNATILMVLWGYIFCSMNTRCAGVTVIFTALLSLAVYLIEAVVQSLGIRTLLMDFALIASSLLLLRASSSVERKTTKSIRSGHPLASLVGSRVLIGLGSGIVVALSGMYRDGSEPNFISSFICLALLVGAVCFLRKKIPGYQIIFLPIIPLLICGIAIAPFVGVSVVHLVLASPAIIWLSWMVLSSVQLSGLRNSVAVSGIALVAIDRISFIMFRFAGGSLLQIQSDSLVARTGSFYISFAIVFAVVTFVTVVLLLLASNHEEQKIIQKMTESADEDFAYIYDSIAEEYSLTSKEREVLAMLAEGHTRPYIADKLFVSDSTARTHARNIYKKLGCHKKEELLDLVLAKKKPLS